MQLGMLARGVAATVTAVAATLLVAPATGPASAAGSLCAGAGVNVVVDFKELPGGVDKGCDPAGADKPAAQVFAAAGFPLTYVTSQPGFVCKVAGEPAGATCERTPPSNAYWGLWWSDGESGTWTYASQGVGSLNVPSGGSVAFAWVGDNGSSPPGIAPPVVQEGSPSPSPTTSPSSGGPTAGSGGQSGPDGGQTGEGGSSGADGTPTGGSAPGSPAGAGPVDPGKKGDRTDGGRPSQDPAKDERKDRDRDDDDASPSAGTTGPSDRPSVSATGDTAVDRAGGTSDDRLPVWVPVGLLALALAGTVTTVVVRRKAGTTG